MPQQKLSVVQIIDTLEPGGAERVLVTLSNLLFAKGHTVKVITILQGGPLEQQLTKGIAVEVLHRTNKFNPITMYRLVQASKGFDVVHVHSSFNLRYLYLSFLLFFCRKKIFFHEHFGNIEIDETVSWHQRFVYPKTILIAVSRKIYDWALHKLQMPTNQVFLLPNIVAKKEMVEASETATNTLKLLLVSNFRRAKNIEFAVDLVQYIKQSQPVQLTIIGQTADETYCNSIKQKILALQLNNEINIVHNCDDVQAILHQFDLAIHTASSESGPLVLIEYMAQGLPFLTNKTGEVVYQIENELPECIINNFNEEEWLQQLQALLLNKKLLSEKLKGVYEKYYSPKTYYNNCINIYKQGLQ